MKKTLLVTFFILFGLVFLCNLPANDKQFKTKIIRPVKIVNVDIPEPSGLYFHQSLKSLYSVSDEDSSVYKITLDGKVRSKFKVNGFDLEGITMIGDSIIVTILERIRTVVFLDTLGNEIKRFMVEQTGRPNEGLEGITYNSKTNTLFIVNEMNPKILVETDLKGKELNRFHLDYAKDFSGLCFDEDNNHLWVISDENSAVFKCNLDGTPIAEYKVDVQQIEGITFNKEANKMYIVSDKLEKLYIYETP